ncbi:MAG: aminoacyl-tRNA hydrolase [Betaproteobacteria bacterium TMED156]|nr:MAG: aminoacyl-tRNA hydrolase [Betaproteobacteria bacterium TMED156]
MDEIRLIIGLGNPELEYGLTRHNAGFWALNIIAQRNKAIWTSEPKFRSEISKIYIGSPIQRCVWLLKPSLYMNESGEAVGKFCFFHKIQPYEILVVHDELDLLPGVLKLKKGGGNAGHNGLKNIQNKLQSSNFWRLRIGIGHPRTTETKIKNVSNFVLSKPTSNEKEKIDQCIDLCVNYVDEILKGEMKIIKDAIDKEK